MTQKDYEAIAEVIRANSHTIGSDITFDEGSTYAGSQIADDLCKLFYRDTQFDSTKFQRDCGFS